MMTYLLLCIGCSALKTVMVSFSLQITRVVRAHGTPQLSSRIARKGRDVLARIAKVVAGVIAILTQAIVTTRDEGQTRP
jgi:hypothetical protein